MAKKTRTFKTEVQQLLDLVVHSLYSKKEIFLRELISNASDAMDRRRFEALTDPALQLDDDAARIRLEVDPEARTLTISDGGIGMSQEEVEANIGTIASSGTRKYLESLQQNAEANPEFIGQFGVGFYSAFMVADKVTVDTLRAGGATPAVRWESTGEGKYTLSESPRKEWGTVITLHLAEGMDEYLESWRLRSIVKAYSDYITYPIVMDVETGSGDEKTVEEQTLNSMKAIWRKAPADVSEEAYTEFYHHVSHDHGKPARTIHYAAEGVTEFRALLFVPEKAPFDLFLRGDHKGVHLYVKNVFITDDCKELLPEYLRFVKGVVDSSDLPLNVSREMLQDDAVIRRIRKSLVGKVLAGLREMKDEQAQDYAAFFLQFGQVLKEGLHTDFENRDKLKELLLFRSTKTEGDALVGLRDVADRAPAKQKALYYLQAENLKTARTSPLLETFRERDMEVLFLTDPVDEWIAPALDKYDGKPLLAIDRGELDLDDVDEEKKKKNVEAAKPLCEAIREALDEDISEVRVSTRLTGSACCLVNDANAVNPAMERMMRAMGQEVPPSKRILEINPDHPLVQRMQTLQEQGDDRLADCVELLHGQALLAEGSPVKDPARFARLLSDLMVDKLAD